MSTSIERGDKMNIKLKIALLKKQVKQQELAKKLKISESLVSYYINGHKEVPEDIKGRIAQILQMKKVDLF